MKYRLVSLSMMFALALAGALGLTLGSCASGAAVSAEEYFSIGMAYYDMGKYAEAEYWLNRAKAMDKTMNASEYNLGRIAFETGRYEDAVGHFEAILRRDPDNVIALRAAAYTEIRRGEIERAAAFYDRLLVLVPESADDGYNHALVLFAMKKYPEAEDVLKNYEFALIENSDVLLLYARIQREQDKPEAIDSYALWLNDNTDAKVRYEYCQLLESHEMYARALDEYREMLDTLNDTSTNPSKLDVRFTIARLLLIAESDKSEGITELREAVAGGFDDLEAIDTLLDDERISDINKDELRAIQTEIRRAADKAQAEAEAEAELELETDPELAEPDDLFETEEADQ